jgi:type IV secretion system protein TrbB
VSSHSDEYDAHIREGERRSGLTPRQLEHYYEYLGPLRGWLEQVDTTSLTANEDDRVWVEQIGQPKRHVADMTKMQRERLISFLANQEFGRAMDRLHSRLQCDAPVFGSRVQAFCDPISRSPIIMRNHARHVVEYDDFIENANPDVVLTSEWGEDRVRAGWDDAITQAIEQHRNIEIGGGVKSGKTTLLNTLGKKKAWIHKLERVVVVQDRHEIVAGHFQDCITLNVRLEQAKNGLNGTTSYFMYEFGDAVQDAMRCDGDSFIWGEVRDPASAIGLGAASNTGTHGIMKTAHYDKPELAPARYEELYREGDRTPNESGIAKLLELCIYTQRDPVSKKGRIVDVQRCLGYQNGQYVFEKVAHAPFVSVPLRAVPD